MNLLTAKIVSMVLLGTLALFFGLLPLKVTSMILKGDENTRKRRRRERIVSCLLCFGSGVLMATVFIHMIPETREGFARAKQLGLWGAHESNHVPEVHDHMTEDDRTDRPLGFHSKNVTKENMDSTHVGHAHDPFHHHHPFEDHVHHEHDHEHGHDHEKHDHVHDHTQSIPSTTTWDAEEQSDFRTTSYDSENLKIKPHDDSGPPEESFRSPLVSSTPHRHNDHSHDHPHDHNIDHPHGHSHDHAPKRSDDQEVDERPTHEGTTTSTYFEPVTSGDQITKFLETVVSEKEKILEHPKENSIRVSGEGLGEAGLEPRSSALTHMEAHHDHGHDHGHEYPLAELVICAGFFLIYVIEEFMHKILFRGKGKTSEKKSLLDKNIENGSSHNHSDHLAHIPHFHAHPHTSSSEDEEANHIPSRNGTGPSADLYQTAKVVGALASRVVTAKGDAVTTWADTNVSARRDLTTYLWMRCADSLLRTMTQRSEWGSHGVDNPVFAGDIDATTWNPKVRNSLVLHNQVSPLPSTDPQKMYGTSSGSALPEIPIEAPKKQVTSKRLSEHILGNFRALLIVMALSFHSVFEGMAVGLQLVIGDVWYLFLAISAHKFVIVFCIGLELLEAKTPLILMIMYIVVLALVSPIGVGIGIMVTENSSFGGHEHTLIIAILQGIAGGTILYVAFLEVLERERSKRGGRLSKLFCLILGFALMASLEALGGHSHAPIQRPG